MNYTTVIGLEIHAELLTKSKIFCGCSSEFGGEENTRVCPRCSGMPGTLPLLNQNAVTLAVKAGKALGCKINNFSAFDRKNYFYPDLPKAYQITQFFYPLCQNGGVNIGEKTVRINRIHIEEDAGKLIHDQSQNLSLADYNRCGVPLIEIVTEPDIRSAEEAKLFMEKVALALKYAEVCDCKMEQGSLRCDVNISVMPESSSEFGTRTEIKNLNSLRSIVRAIEYEAKRQKSLLEKGEKITQETLHFDDSTGETSSLRSKEEAHDYRYFPEPDIPPLFIKDEEIDAIFKTMPEMPDSRLKRYQEKMGLNKSDSELLVAEKSLSDFFDRVVENYNEPKSVANMVLGEMLRRINDLSLSVEKIKFAPVDLAKLCKMADTGVVSRGAAKDILKEMFLNGEKPMDIAKKQNMIMSNDSSEVEKVADQVLAENTKAVEEFKEGSGKVFGFLMGQMCRKLGKSANPAIIKKVLEEKLK